MSKNKSTRRASGKRNLAVAGFLLGSGAAMAITTSGVASAEPHLNNQPNPSPNPIVAFAQEQFNNPKPGTHYSDGVYQAWCANFVSYALREAGAPLGGINGWRNPAVVGLQKNFANKGILESRNYVPKPGDTVLYGGDHTNIVVDVRGDEIVTIGGNETNGGISHRTISRHAGKITGYGRTSELVQATPAPAPEPFNQFAPPPPEPVEPHPVWGAPPPPPAPFVEPFNPFAPPPAPEPAPFVEPAPAPAPVEHLPAPAPMPEPAPFVEPAPVENLPAPEPLPGPAPAPFVEPAPAPAPAPWDMAPPPPAPVDPFLPPPPAPGPELLPPPAPEAFIPPPPAPMPWELPPPPAPDMFAPPAPMPELPPPPPPAPWEAPVVPVADVVPAPGPELPPPPAPGGIYLLSALP